LLYCGGEVTLNSPYDKWSVERFNGDGEEEISVNEEKESKKRKISPEVAKEKVMKLLDLIDGTSVKPIMKGFIETCNVLRVKDLKKLESDLSRSVNEARLKGIHQSTSKGTKCKIFEITLY
jgi:hypothetical protein